MARRQAFAVVATSLRSIHIGHVILQGRMAKPSALTITPIARSRLHQCLRKTWWQPVHRTTVDGHTARCVALLLLVSQTLRVWHVIIRPVLLLALRRPFPSQFCDIDLTKKLLGDGATSDVCTSLRLALSLTVHDTGVAQRIERVLRVLATGRNCGDDCREVPVRYREAAAKELGEPVLSEGHELGSCRGGPDAVLQSAQRGVDLRTLFLPFCVVLRIVDAMFGAGEVN
mmetsp:Transcript_29920/g.79686  ORF Transcript_29920/g.79686 Transcript_29920/m.79686 type:complete len:229 (+) Transcript_29920:2090-2776(+)